VFFSVGVIVDCFDCLHDNTSFAGDIVLSVIF